MLILPTVSLCKCSSWHPLRGDQHSGHQSDNGRCLCYGHALAYHHARRLAPGLSQRRCLSYRTVLVGPGKIYLIVAFHAMVLLTTSISSFPKGVIWLLIATVAGVLPSVSLTSRLGTDLLFHSHLMSRSLFASI